MLLTSDRVRLAAVVFGVLLAQVLLYPGIDTLMSGYGANSVLGASMWFLAAEFAAFISFAAIWGAVSDATGRRIPWIVLGAVGGAVGYAALAFLPSVIEPPFSSVIILRIMQGAATIGPFSLAMTMLMDLEGGHGRNMGAAGIAIGLGTALGAPIGGQLYEIGPFVPLYAASVLMLIVAIISMGAAERSPGADHRSVRQLLAGFKRSPILGIPYAFGFIDRLTAGFFALVGTLYFRRVFELSPGQTGLMLMLFFAPFALLQYPMGIVSDRVGRTIPILAGSTLYGIGVIAVGHAPNLLFVGLSMIAVGVLGATMAPATMALVTDIAKKTERGVAMAGFNICGSLGFLAGILVGGIVASTSDYRTAFLAIGLLEIAIALAAVPIFFTFLRDSV